MQAKLPEGIKRKLARLLDAYDKAGRAHADADLKKLDERAAELFPALRYSDCVELKKARAKVFLREGHRRRYHNRKARRDEREARRRPRFFD